MKIYKLMSGVYEVWKNDKMTHRIYKNRWGGWTIAIFHERCGQFVDSRYFGTFKQAKQAIL